MQKGGRRESDDRGEIEGRGERRIYKGRGMIAENQQVRYNFTVDMAMCRPCWAPFATTAHCVDHGAGGQIRRDAGTP